MTARPAIRAATLFSGIGCPEIAAPWIDWRFAAEIDPFASAVMAERFPHIPNLGDVTAPDFIERAREHGPVDLVVFGSPCQSFSFAGKRLGLDDPRGNLALVALRVVAALRPRWICFENVLGLLSTFSGSEHAERQVREGPVGGQASGEESRDFATFLSRLRECGYLGVWRVLDAQFAGVPQRRRRIFFIGHLGDWRPAAAVLLEPESLRGDPPPRGAAGQGIAPTVTSGAPSGGPAHGSRSGSGKEGLIVPVDDEAIPLKDPSSKGEAGALRNAVCGEPGDPMFALMASDPHGVAHVSGTVSAKWAKGTGGPSGDEAQNLVTHALRGEGFDASEDGTGRGTPIVPHSVIAFDQTQITSPENRSRCEPGEAAPSLARTAHPPTIAFQANLSNQGVQTDRPTLTANAPTAVAHPYTLAYPIQADAFGRSGEASEGVKPPGAGVGEPGDAMFTLDSSRPHAIAFAEVADPIAANQARTYTREGNNFRLSNVALDDDGRGVGMAVRRLTPRECERLQGLPDDWTLVKYRGKPAADSPRYRAIGNGMAVPVMRWILDRIGQFEDIRRSGCPLAEAVAAIEHERDRSPTLDLEGVR